MTTGQPSQASAGLLFFLAQQPVILVALVQGDKTLTDSCNSLANLTHKLLQRAYEPPSGQGGL